MQTSTPTSRRELAHRVADQIEVQLPVAPERALHAFHHPFAYAA
jgi:hypothetical protein